MTTDHAASSSILWGRKLNRFQTEGLDSLAAACAAYPPVE
jgi:hypothetical protein